MHQKQPPPKVIVCPPVTVSADWFMLIPFSFLNENDLKTPINNTFGGAIQFSFFPVPPLQSMRGGPCWIRARFRFCVDARQAVSDGDQSAPFHHVAPASAHGRTIAADRASPLG
jgi:hypothetical protein